LRHASRSMLAPLCTDTATTMHRYCHRLHRSPTRSPTGPRMSSHTSTRTTTYRPVSPVSSPMELGIVPFNPFSLRALQEGREGGEGGREGRGGGGDGWVRVTVSGCEHQAHIFMCISSCAYLHARTSAACHLSCAYEGSTSSSIYAVFVCWCGMQHAGA
jgi:hypothetical protein